MGYVPAFVTCTQRLDVHATIEVTPALIGCVDNDFDIDSNRLTKAYINISRLGSGYTHAHRRCRQYIRWVG